MNNKAHNMSKKKKIWTDPIDKHVDWGGDATTENLPVAGSMVQKFIRDTLEGKVGYLHPDPANENYWVFADEENYDKYLEDPVAHEDLLMAVIPLASNYSVELTLVDTQDVNYINYGSTGNYIHANFKVKNKSGSDINDDFDITVTFRNGSASKKVNRKASSTALFTMNVDEYLMEGTNSVTITALSKTFHVSTSATVVFHSIILKVSDTLDISAVYDNEHPIPAVVHIEGSGTKKIEWYVDGVQLPFNSISDETPQSSTYLTRYISVQNLPDGRHNLQYRAYVNINGVSFYSDVMYRDFIVYRGSGDISLVVNAFSFRGDILDPMIMPIPLSDIQQYVVKEIRYATFDTSDVESSSLVVTLGTTEDVFNTNNYIEYTYELKSYVDGSVPLKFQLNDSSIIYNLDISETTMNLSSISDTEFEFEGTLRTNSSSDRNLNAWSFVSHSGSTYRAIMTGFDFTERNGWTMDGLMISEGADLTFTYQPLNYNIAEDGLTFEVEFETRHVLDDDEVICDLRRNGVGIVITASEAKIISQQGVELSTKYKAEERTRITFVVNPLSNELNKGLVFIFVNGILSGVKNYASGDSFTSDRGLYFSGSSDAQILLNQIRCYKRALLLEEVLNNYILYRPTIDELLSAYEKNDILDNNVLSIDKLSAYTPIIIITGDVDELQNFTKTDKGTFRKMEKIEVINVQEPTRNMTLINPSMRCQGTSSMNYPKKNFRFYTQEDNADSRYSYTTQMFDSNGKELFGEDRVYSFKKDAQPVHTWCLKADYAESSSTHNTGTARIWNDVLKNMVIENVDSRYKSWRNTTTPGRTDAQQAAIDNNYPYDVRTTVDGFPIVLFFHRYEDDPLIFLGKYNWNNDKSTESVFGFKDIPGFNDSSVECWEVVNGDYPENLFTDISEWDNTIEYEGKTMKCWERAFEARYPDKNKDTTALKAFATWINGLKSASKIQDGKVVVDNRTIMSIFTAQKWEHLDVYKVAAYYVYLMRFGAVDQTVKNAMFTTEDGQHWYYINYDNDTINGLDNNGALSFGYLIDRQSIDERTGFTYCYAGHDSVLWNNLEADEDFMNIVKIVDQALYDVGLRYSSVIDMYNNKQSAKWSERLHNMDSQYKYLDPWNNDNSAVGLPKLQGSRDSHRQWWLSNRFALYDAKNVTGAYKANSFIARVSMFNLPEPVNAYVTPGVDNQIFGYGKDKVPIVYAVPGYAGTPIEMPISGELYVGASLDFYNAVFIKKIDISCISQYLTAISMSAINSDSFESCLEEIVLGSRLSEPNLNALTNLAELGNAKYLKKLSICKLNGLVSVDLSENKYFEELDATGCERLANVIFPDAAPIKRLYFSSALQRLALKDVTTIETLSLVDNGANILTFDIRGCSINGLTNNPSILFNWMNERGNAQGELNVYVDNIKWRNVDPDDVIEFTRYVRERGTLTLKGMITLSSLNIEQLDTLFELFGYNCFESGASLRFIGHGVFITGPSEVLSGGEYQYKFLNATDQYIVPSWSVTGARATQFNGLVTVPERTTNDTTMTVKVSYLLDGESLSSEKVVAVKRRIYPDNGTIVGDTRIDGINTFTWTTTTEGVNGDCNVIWEVSGDISSLVQIVSHNETSCVIEYIGTNSGTASGTLTLTVRKKSDNTLLFEPVTKTISAMDVYTAFTDITDPELMAVMYNNRKEDGTTRLAAHSTYMLKDECNAVINEDLYKNVAPTQANSIFYSNTTFRNNCKNMKAFAWFTNISEIPEYCFKDTSINTITIPANVQAIRKEGLNVTTLTDVIFNGSSIELYENSLYLNFTEDSSVNCNFVFKHSDIDLTQPCLKLRGNYVVTLNKISLGSTGSFSMIDSSVKELHILDCTGVGSGDKPIFTNNTKLYLYKGLGSRFTNMGEVYLEDDVVRIPNYAINFTSAGATVTCHTNIESIGSGMYFDETHRLYLLSNTSVPVECRLENNKLTGKCIVVRHDMLSSFQNDFPDIAEHFTDDFTIIGDYIDWSFNSADDVIGEAVATILHMSRKYSGVYADGTPGEVWENVDIEQPDNFFSENDTNNPIPRTISYSENGKTETRSITQAVKNNTGVKYTYALSKTVSVSTGDVYYKNGHKKLSGNFSVVANDVVITKKDVPNFYFECNGNDNQLYYKHVYVGSNALIGGSSFDVKVLSSLSNVWECPFISGELIGKFSGGVSANNNTKRINSNEDGTIEINESVTDIMHGGFINLSYIKKVVFPTTLTRVTFRGEKTSEYSGYTGAFAGCSSINELIFKTAICPTLGNGLPSSAGGGVQACSFANTGVLKYPAGSSSSYSTLKSWLPSGWTVEEITI